VTSQPLTLPQVIVGCSGRTELPGPDPLIVVWQCEDDGRAVSGRLESRQQSLPYRLDARRPSIDFRLGERYPTGVVWLSLGRMTAHLCGDVQTGPSTVFESPIAEWPLTPTPPPPTPAPRRNDGVVLEPAPGASELMTLLATVDAPPPPAARSSLRLLFYDGTALDLPLVAQLAALRQETDAAVKMAGAASAFEANSAGFVPTLSVLGTPPAAFPELLARLRALGEGHVSLAELKLLTEETLELGDGIAAYLESTAAQEAEGRLWQSLVAWAWAAPQVSADPFAVRAGVRAFGILRHLAADDERLTDASGRQTALDAVPVLPADVAPLPGAALPQPGFTRVLGPGLLQTVSRAFRGYEPGEIAVTVNVLPHERQRISERSLSRRSEAERDSDAEAGQQSREQEHKTRSEDRDALEDVIASEGRCRDWNASITYTDGLTHTDSGWLRVTNCPRRQVARQALLQAQGLVQTARERVDRRVARQRERRLVEERERLASVDRDNRTGAERQVGIYRFLRERVELRLHDRGARLVCEFLVRDPAAEYLRGLEQATAPPLVAPPPLKTLAPTYKSVVASNYRALAARYGVADPPPPPEAARTLRVLLESAPPQAQAQIDLPAGFALQGGELAWTVSDASLPAWGFVGDFVFGSASTRGLRPLPLAAGNTDAPPACSCPAPPPPPVPPTPGHGTVTFTAAQVGPASGRLPVGLVSTSEGYWGSVRLALARDDEEYQDDLEAWQLSTYAVLDAAYGRQLAAYRAALKAQIRRSSAERHRGVETEALRAGALALLWERHAPVDTDRAGTLRALEGAFAWPDVAYRFYPWGPGAAPQPEAAWTGEALVDPESDRLFTDFLRAGSARVLAPVVPGRELDVLFYYVFGFLPPGMLSALAVPEQSAALLQALFRVEEAPPPPAPVTWFEHVPTSLLYLQEGSSLKEDVP
jgi:hypothetical protein